MLISRQMQGLVVLSKYEVRLYHEPAHAVITRTWSFASRDSRRWRAHSKRTLLVAPVAFGCVRRRTLATITIACFCRYSWCVVGCPARRGAADKAVVAMQRAQSLVAGTEFKEPRPVPIGDVMGDVMRLLPECGVVLAGDVAAAVLAIAMTEGLILGLDPTFDIVGNALPYVAAVAKHGVCVWCGGVGMSFA